MKKNQKPGYLVIGSVVIGIVSILIIYVVLIATGLIQVSKNHIVITTASAEKVYDGAELTADWWELAYGNLLAGHEIQAEVIGKQTEVGTSDNNIALVIYDSQGADVTADYEIEYQLGTLSVKGKLLSFATGSAQKYYDGEPLTIATDAWQFVGGELSEGHSYTATAVGHMTTIGSTPVKLAVSVVDAEGRDVSSQYSIEVIEGVVAIAPRRIIVSLETSGTVSEEGADLESNGTIVSGSLLEGHTAKYRSMQNSNGNYSAETVFVWVVDENGNDVTDFYEIVTALGDMTIENPNTFFPRVPSDLLDTSEYEDLFDGSLGEYIEGNPGGLDINGDGVVDFPIDENGMIDIDGDGVGDVPAGLAGLALLKCYIINTDRDGYVYLRERSYGDYDGNDWTDPEIYGYSMTPYLFSAEAASIGGGASSSATVTPLLEGLRYSTPYYYNAGFGSSYNDCYSDIYPTANAAYAVSYIPYEFLEQDNLPLITDLSADDEYYDYVLNTYRTMSGSLYEQFMAIAEENGLSSDDPDIIVKVAEYIRGAAQYNLDFAEIPGGEEGVIYFLTDGKEGVCRHFATAATLMYRTMGIPARYVTGFATEAEAGKDTVVTALQAHAWVEVYIDNVGWVQVEVTPGSSGQTPGGGTQPTPSEGPESGLNGNNPMGSVPDDVKNGGNQEVAVIMTPKKGYHYLRTESYGDYDGTNWFLPKTYGSVGTISVTPFTVNLLALRGGASYDMSIRIVAQNIPYMAPYLTEKLNEEATSNDCVITAPGISEYRLSYRYYDYFAASSWSKVSSEYSDIESLYYQQVKNQYLNIDGEIEQYLLEKMKKDGFTAKLEVNSDGSYKANKKNIQLIAAYVQSLAEYDSDYSCKDAPAGVDGIRYFIEESKEGVCRHFATVGTLIFRTLDIPARYTVGFLVNSTGNETTVFMKNAHAWVEVYVEGTGWIQVEVTAPDTSNLKLDIHIPTSSAKSIVNGKALVSGNINWDKIGSANNGEWEYIPEENKCIYVGEEKAFEGWWFSTEGVVTTGSITYVGSTTNRATGIVIKNDAGNTVPSSKYTLKYDGKLERTAIEIRFTAAGGVITDEKRYYNELESVEIVTEGVSSLITEYDANGNAIRTHKLEDFTVVYEYDKDNPIPEDELEFVTKNRIMKVNLVIGGVDIIERYYHVTYGEHGMLTYEE